jgi:hypothetical protein
MPEPKTEPNITCLMEQFVRGMGWVLVHDGQNSPGQVQVQPEDIRYYTKKYQKCVKGQLYHTWMIFKYDLRNKSVSFEFHSQEMRHKGREKMQIQNGKEAVSEKTI